MTKTVRIAQGGPQLWPPSSSQNILLVPFLGHPVLFLIVLFFLVVAAADSRYWLMLIVFHFFIL